jgi:hypothetical protein
MNTLRHFLSVAPLLGLAFSLVAQQPLPTPQIDDPVTSLSRSVGLTPDGSGGFTAIALAYKARLSPLGVEYTPMLGEAAPRNLPLSLQTGTVQRGGAMLHRAAPVAPSAVGNSVIYDRGACRETWDVTPQGLKLSWAFDRPLGGDGDLVVRCDWQSELEPHADGERGVDFRWPQVGGVRVDSVVGVDAAGRRAAGSVRLVGGFLEFVLPDSFVDSATYPLVLDPLIGSAFLVAGSGNTTGSDIAIEQLGGISLVVFQARASTADIDIFAQRLNSVGSLLGGLINIDSTSAFTRRPRVGFVTLHDRFLVVWEQSASLFAQRDIYGAAVDALNGVVAGPVAIAATPSSEFEPAVAGEATTVDDDAIVVWRTENQQYQLSAGQVTLQATGDPVLTALVVIANSSSIRVPAISKAIGTGGRALIVWQELDQIRGQYITRNLTLLGPSALLSNTVQANTNPSCDGDNGDYLVCWERTEAASPGNRDVVCARIGGGTSGLVVNVAESAVGGLAAVDECEPDIAWMGLRYGLVYTQRQSTITDNVRAVLVSPDCTSCNVNHTLVGFGPALREGSPRIAARHVGLASSDDAMITYTESDELPPFSSDIDAQRLQVLGNGITPTNLLGGCALGGTNTTTGGPFVIGNPNFAFRVTGADPAALLFLSLGLPSGGLICGSCTFTNPIALDLKTNSAGTATSVFALPCDPSLVNFQLESQWISFGTAFTPCPLLSGISASNRLLFTLSN